MKHFNKFLILLAFLGLSISSVNAQFAGGDGSEGYPYQIATAAQLAGLATYVNNGDVAYNNKYYILNNDIDLSDYQSDSGWAPIGQIAKSPFKGNFNGNNKIITGLIIDNSKSMGNFGLFGTVDGGTITNLGIEDVEIRNRAGAMGSSSCGGVAGYLHNNGTISNCYATGKVDNLTGSASSAGGIIGDISESTISNCYSAMEVSSSGRTGVYSGGIVGSMDHNSKVSNCYSIGTVNSTGASGTAASGGIVGNNTSGCTIENCAALNPKITCKGSSTKNFGRVVGNNTGTLTNNIAFNEMINPDDETIWNNIDLTDIDGADITGQEIYEDGTLGNRFTEANGWTIENGYLPGLFGNLVDIPPHLPYVPNGIKTITNEQIQVYPNPTSGELRIESVDIRVESVDIFDVYGRNVGSKLGVVFDISNFPTGIYFLKIHTENGIVTKKVVKQ